MKIKLVSRLLPLLTFVLISALSSTSFATTAKPNCSVTMLQFDEGRIVLVCNNDNVNSVYYGFDATIYAGFAGCTHINPDTQKIWVSMLQSSMLAGRTVDFDYAPASSSCGSNTIVALRTH